MRKKIYLFATLFLIFSAVPAFAQDWVKMMQDPNVNFYDVQKAFNKYYAEKKREIEREKKESSSRRSEARNEEEEEVPGYMQYKRWEWFMEPRVSATGERFNPSAVWQEMQNYKQQYGSFLAGNWTYIGPNTEPAGGGVGRCNFVRVHPTNPNTIYVGSPSGGLWKSINGGINWTTNTDQLPQVIGCTDIAIDPVNTNTMYLATGDGDASDTYTVGLLKSTDGGTTWNPTGLSFNVPQSRTMSKVLINPTNTNIILVATSAGIYRSTDGGTTFTNVQAGSFKDMEFRPADPTTVYACGAQFFKSTDGGATWTNITSGLPAATAVSRMAIAVSANNQNIVYVIAAKPATDYGFQGLYKSTNSGTTFAQVTVTSPSNVLGWASAGNDVGGQGWYTLSIAASPTNANEIIVGGVNIWRSINGGTSFTLNAHWTGTGAPYVHADIHDLIYVNGTTYWAGCDGGTFKTINSGSTWSDLGNDLQIAQMYGFGQSTTNASLLLQGWQDNGTNRLNGATWNQVMGGDGMLAFISSNNDNNMWGSQYNGTLNRSTNGGATWGGANGGITETGAWVTPWRESPTTPNTLYAGFVNVWRSTNGGVSWAVLGSIPGTNTIQAIAVSPANTQVIWAAKGSTLYKTSNGGGTWTAITSLPPGRVSYIACHNTDANKAWVTYAGFTNSNKIFQTADQGTTWTNLSGSIPNIPVNCVTYVNGSNDGLYIGTAVGVYYKDATMNVWQPFSTGLPNVEVTQIEIFYAGNKLRASTYGRGMWESTFYVPGNYAPLANFAANQLIACPGAAVQFTDYSAGQPTAWTWSFPGGSPSSSSQQNPLVYYNNSGTYAVTLTVSNPNGSNTKTVNGYINIATSPYAAPTTVNDSVCAPGGVVNLTATPSVPGTVRWWNAPGGGSIVATGNTYSPNITATTWYYVDEAFSQTPSPSYAGAPDNTMGTGSMFTANDIRGLYFDVLSPVIINTVDVYSNSAGNRTIEIIDPQGNTYTDTTVLIPASPTVPTTVTINRTVYPGTGYFIKCRGLVDLYRNNAGAGYPYLSPSINVTGSNAGLPGYYYFFYNWTYTNIVCNTSRTPVKGIVYTCNGVHDLFADGDLSVFPNPNNGSFDLSFLAKNRDNYSIKVYDALGQVVFDERADNFTGNYSRKIDLSSNGKGVYMLIVSNGKNDSFRKVVVF